MFENEQMTSRLTSLFGEAKRAFDIETRYLGINTAQKLARLIGGMALAAVLILVGGTVMLFGSFALAYWLADITGSIIEGFAIMAAALALACAIVYWQRRAWILEPIIRFVANIFVAPEIAQNSVTLNIEEQRLAEQREQSYSTLHSQAQGILQPARQASSRWDSASNLISTALAIYEGLRMGHSTMTALRRVFGRKK
jgi:hypothetical protein